MTDRSKTFPIWSADNTRFFGSFLLTLILVYFFPRLGMPNIINQVAFLLLLAYIYRSRDDVFWLSWFFVIVSGPGRLFLTASGVAVYRLPFYNIAPGVSLSFTELFLLIYLLKFLRMRFGHRTLYSGYFTVILIYGMIVLLYSPVLGMKPAEMATAVRYIIPWLWVLILPAFISDEAKLARSYTLLAPFVFVTLMLTIQSLITGTFLHDILSGRAELYSLAEDELLRITHAANLTFIGMLLSLYYISKGDRRFNSNYLNAVLIAAGLIIFLSATRGWILGMFVLLASVFLMRGFNLLKQAMRVIVILGLVFSITQFIYPSLMRQTSGAFDRMMTLEQLAGGDLTAGGTLSRITFRGPRVMAYYRESPVLGWGFSSTFFAHQDGHVGNQNMLMQGGVMGYALWMLVFVMITLTTFRYSQLRTTRERMGRSGMVFVLGLLATLVIHSSSTQMWGFYSAQQAPHLQWAWLLAAANVSFLVARQRN